MQWSMVEIEDNNGKKHKGSDAMNFVLDNIEGTVIVKPYSGDKFALSYNGKNHVSSDDVFKVLADKLAGKCRAIKVEGLVAPPKSTFVPNVEIQNPINKVAKYTITFELGDIDALFEPVAQKAKPWEDKGVQQRLQALGYLYTPLQHPGNNGGGEFKHAKACWEYYKRVHKSEADDAAALEKLKNEIVGNLIAKSFPKSGEVLAKSKLPTPGTFAAIRFPGGYCTSKSPVTGLSAGDHFFNKSNPSSPPSKYDFRIGDRRSDIEKLVFEENEFIGKLPLIAKVTADWGDGKIEPVKDVPVHFQLIVPDALNADNPFRAGEARNVVMDYSFDLGAFKCWQEAPPKEFPGLSQEDWDKAKKIASDLAKKAELEGEAEIEAIRKKEIEDIVKLPEKIKEFNDLSMKKSELEAEFERFRESGKVDDEVEKALAEAKRLCAEVESREPENPTSPFYTRWVDKQKKGTITPEETVKLQAFEAKKAAYDKWLTEESKPAEEKRKAALAKKEALFPKKVELEETVKNLQNSGINKPDLPSNITPIMEKANIKVRDAAKETRTNVLKSAGITEPQSTHVDYIFKEAEKFLSPNSVFNLKRVPANLIKDSIKKDYEIADADVKNISKKVGDIEKNKREGKLKDELAERERITKLESEKTALNKELKKAEALRNELYKPYIFKMELEKADELAQATDSVIFRYLLANHGFDKTLAIEISNAGPKRFIDDLLKEFEDKADADDPQKSNAPQDYGGKSGKPVEGNIFETAARKRFNDGHPDCGALPLAAKSGKPHAVKSLTNEQGFAGAIFMPSHCGGDRYKLRAFIDEEWLEKKKSGQPHKSTVDTGTMVVWRNIRIYKYLQLKNPRVAYSEKLQKTLKGGKSKPEMNPNHPVMFLDTDLTPLSLLPGNKTEPETYKAVDIAAVKKNKMMFRPLPVNPEPFEVQLRWANCELIFDDSGIKELEDGERRKAEQLGLQGIKKFWKHPKKVDWDKILYSDATSPFLCNFLSYEQYEEQVSKVDASCAPLDANDEAETTAIEKGLQWFYEAMMEHYAGGGVFPGLTIVQIPRGDTWDLNALDVKTTVTSGYGTGARGFYLSHTNGVYHNVFHIYPATSNAIHEIGHVLGLAHQPPAGADIEDAHQKPVKVAFRRPNDDQCVCVMSYSGCYGDLCGKCIMSLRGWAQTHVNKLYD